MTVRYRCGQSNDLSPVWIFYYLLMRDKRISYLSWADKLCALNLNEGGWYYRKDKIIEI